MLYEYQERGGYAAEADVVATLAGVGLRTDGLPEDVAPLSGGGRHPRAAAPHPTTLRPRRPTAHG